MCSAGLRYIAVLDWYGPESRSSVLAKGEGVGVTGLQIACETRIQGGKSWGIPQKKIRPSYIDYVLQNFLCRLPLVRV